MWRLTPPPLSAQRVSKKPCVLLASNEFSDMCARSTKHFCNDCIEGGECHQRIELHRNCHSAPPMTKFYQVGFLSDTMDTFECLRMKAIPPNKECERCGCNEELPSAQWRKKGPGTKDTLTHSSCWWKLLSALILRSVLQQ